MSDDYAEATVAALISDLEDVAWIASQNGLDDVAERAARELAAARVQYADIIGCCD